MAERDNTCYTFKETGSCRFGNTCRFSHGDGFSGAPAAGGFGGASRSNECYQWKQTGACKFGDSCRFSHGYGAPRRFNNNRGFGFSRAPIASKNQECYTFKESGSCQYGDACRFAHGTEDSRDLIALKRRANGVCHAWRDSGDCKFGNSCRFAHENLPESEMKTESS